MVTASGAVELWHVACPVEASIAVPIDPPESAKPRRRWTYAVGGAAIAMAFVAWPRTAHPAVTFDVTSTESIALPQIQVSRDDAAPTDEQRYAVPIVGGQPLDEQFPSLVDWTYPVTGTAERMPEQASRHFGAERQGVMRTECGAGHCGVDLDGPRGRAIVVVADGVVVRVERHELGLDGRSGRYVRVEHDDGTLTSYMHLDEVAEGLEVGDHVDGGQYVGTLGATAVYASVPHLHFSLEVPNHPGMHGDTTDTHYVDPAPFLVRAQIAPAPDRRRGTKPAM